MLRCENRNSSVLEIVKREDVMNTNRENEIVAGVFYIIATVAPSLTFILLGFLDSPDYLIKVSANENLVVGAMFIELVWALAVVGIPVFLFPILKRHHEALALGFFSLRLIEAISTIAHSIILLSLMTLSQEYSKVGVPDTSHYQVSGNLFLAARDWTFLLGSGLVWSLSALILNYLLYRSRLIPRWLSVWGLVGAILSFANYLPQFFGSDSVVILFLPIAVQEMVFAIWLIVKGFKSSASAPGAASQT
jgi:hypothetical protein